MIRITCELLPYGMNFPSTIANITVSSGWDRKNGNVHNYDIYIPNTDTHITGTIPKIKSGHGNILHTLQNVLQDANLDQLEDDYSSVRKKKRGKSSMKLSKCDTRTMLGRKVKSVLTGAIGEVTQIDFVPTLVCYAHDICHSATVVVEWNNGRVSVHPLCDYGNVETI